MYVVSFSIAGGGGKKETFFAKSRGAAVILGESFCFAKAICFKKEEDDEGSGVEMTLTYLMLIV